MTAVPHPGAGMLALTSLLSSRPGIQAQEVTVIVSVHNKSVNGPVRARLQAARQSAAFRALALPLGEVQDWVASTQPPPVAVATGEGMPS